MLSYRMDDSAVTGDAIDVGLGPDADFVALLGVELPRIQRVARLLVGDPDEAEDLVAEAIARTLPKWRAGTVDDCPAYRLLSRDSCGRRCRGLRR